VRIAGIQGLSLIDYPGHVATVLFLAGCDFRCPFCQNPDLVEPSAELPTFTVEQTVEFIGQRRKLVDGIVSTGGEPLLSPKVAEFAARLRDEVGLPLKVDTNGHHPETLRRLLEEKLAHYVAMDLKTAPSGYGNATGTLVDIHRLEESIRLILAAGVPYEFRTTVVPGLVDEAAVDEMGRAIRGAKRWAFQQYQNRVVMDEKYHGVRPLPPDRVRALALRAEPFVGEVVVRGL